MSVPTALMTVASMQPAPTQRAALSAHVIKDTLVMGKLAEVNMIYTCPGQRHAYALCMPMCYAYVLV